MTIMTSKTKIISAQEAAEILANEDAEFFPYQMLNEAGCTAVTNWVNKNAKSQHSMEPWFSEVTDRAGEGYDRLEMSQFQTVSGRPELLSIDAEWLDYHICYNDDQK